MFSVFIGSLLLSPHSHVVCSPEVVSLYIQTYTNDLYHDYFPFSRSLGQSQHLTAL